MVQQTETSNPDEQRYGQHWKEADRVRDYVSREDREDREAAERAEVFGVLISILPFDPQASIRILDIGSGHGVVAAALLDAFPNAQAIGLDMSDAMMEIGRERMAGYGVRFRYHVGDFSGGALPADLDGPFDLVVSSRAIHHLPPEGKRRLYADVYQHLTGGGCFFNIDNMRPRDDYLRDLYRQAGQPRQVGARPQVQRTGGGHREHPDPVPEQLGWLQEAGFDHVDCFWKRLGRSMIGGYR